MATDWTAPIDAYCERVDASFWSEPVNALSNAGFLVAAAIAFRAGGGPARARPAGAFLIAAVAVVGVGSFLFHTFANRWSRLADVIPIAVFIYGYFALAMRRSPARACGERGDLASSLSASGSSGRGSSPSGRAGIEATNGSVGYFPAALALFAVGAALIVRGHGRDSRPPAAAGQALLVAAAPSSCRSPSAPSTGVLRGLAGRDALRLARAERGGPLHSRRGGHALSGCGDLSCNKPVESSARAPGAGRPGGSLPV